MYRRKFISISLLILLIWVVPNSTIVSSAADTIPEGRIEIANDQIRTTVSESKLKSIGEVQNGYDDVYFAATQSSSVGVDDTLGRFSDDDVDIRLQLTTSHDSSDSQDCTSECASGLYTTFGSYETNFYVMIKMPSGNYMSHDMLKDGLTEERFRMGPTEEEVTTEIPSELEFAIDAAQLALGSTQYGTALSAISSTLKAVVAVTNPDDSDQYDTFPATKNGNPALKIQLKTLKPTLGERYHTSGSSLDVKFRFEGLVKGIYRVETFYDQRMKVVEYTDGYPTEYDGSISGGFSSFDVIRHSTDPNYSDHYARVIKLSASDSHALPTVNSNLISTVNGQNWFVTWGHVDTHSTFSVTAAPDKTNYDFDKWVIDGAIKSQDRTATLSVSDIFSNVVADYVYIPPSSGGGGGGDGGGDGGSVGGGCISICLTQTNKNKII